MRLAAATAVLVGGVMGSRTAPAAAVTPSVDAFVLTDRGTSLAILTLSFQGVGNRRAITGLQPEEWLHAIDVRPTTGQLFGLGSSSRLYVIDPFTTVATAVGPELAPLLSGTRFGFDFSPVADRIRVTSDTGQNLRLHPATGAVTVDTPLNGATTGTDASASTSSAGMATSTTLYGISASTGTLYVQNPNAGTLTPVGPLGVGPISSTLGVGFDIMVSGTSTRAFATMRTTGSTALFEVDLATGAAVELGQTGFILDGLAIANPTSYCAADVDGEVACAGLGRAGGQRPPIPGLAAGIVDAVQTNTGLGVWQVALDGGVFASGDAEFSGSAGGIPLAQEVVGMAATPTGRGYWLVAADGGVFAYGDAGFFGSVPGVLAPGQSLNQPIVAIAGTGTGRGYWLGASDGGIFAFGDAAFLGSVPGVLAPGQSLLAPVVAMTRNETGPGYYLMGLDGGVFNFGGRFIGSAGGQGHSFPYTDIAAAGPTGGYRIMDAVGGIISYETPVQGGLFLPQPADFMVGLAG